ncbi:P1 family peptidase [Rhodopseudomonas sp. B29]|uniref:P1 family peptidase n=1 Tax=Rhodopseudomonas sp. B29 TaxID=95607 RepID=UPI00034B0853|nr:P1 family peptidase [Rhodopseudomonas sp. B29]
MTTSDGDILLQADGIDIGYGRVTVIHGASLSVKRGQIIAIIGPNGAGKTTLLSGLMGLLPVKGRLSYFGETMSEQPSVEQLVGRGVTLIFTLSGGSAFGLDSGGGVQAWLAAQGRGFAIGNATIPIVPGAVVFDMLNGGDKNWGRFSPYRDLGYAAAADASDDFALGSVGAGLGATTANYKGGLGSASATTPSGVTVGAIAVVNAIGSAVIGDGPWFWSAPFEQGDEFGGFGLPAKFGPEHLAVKLKGAAAASAVENTTLVTVVTDAVLTKTQVKRLAMLAQTGFARAIYPVHAPLDGDVVFAAATGVKPVEPLAGLTELGAIAANTVARAIARGVYEATRLPFKDAQPAWRDRFARS